MILLIQVILLKKFVGRAKKGNILMIPLLGANLALLDSYVMDLF